MNDRVTGSTNHVSCEVADEVVILSLENGEYFGLNPVAARIWLIVQQPRTVSEIRDVLVGEYTGVTPGQCLDQVIALLEEMVDLELVRLG